MKGVIDEKLPSRLSIGSTPEYLYRSIMAR